MDARENHDTYEDITGIVIIPEEQHEGNEEEEIEENTAGEDGSD